MIRGTTPTHIFRLPIETDTIRQLRITYNQCGKTVLEGYTAYGANGARIVGTASATKRREVTISLPLAGWVDGVQTVSVSGVPADATVIIGGTPGSDYNEFEVYCSEQGSGTLTFTAPYQPNGDLTANAVILT